MKDLKRMNQRPQTSKHHRSTAEEVWYLMQKIPNVQYLKFSFQQLSFQYEDPLSVPGGYDR